MQAFIVRQSNFEKIQLTQQESQGSILYRVYLYKEQLKSTNVSFRKSDIS